MGTRVHTANVLSPAHTLTHALQCANTLSSAHVRHTHAALLCTHMRLVFSCWARVARIVVKHAALKRDAHCMRKELHICGPIVAHQLSSSCRRQWQTQPLLVTSDGSMQSRVSRILDFGATPSTESLQKFERSYSLWC